MGTRHKVRLPPGYGQGSDTDSLRSAPTEETALVQMADQAPPSYTEPNADPLLHRSTAKRITCLDTLRGMAIIGMVFVNQTHFTGDLYWIGHSTWNGLQFADCIMPLFLFTMGAALSFKYLARTRTKSSRSVIWHVLRRTIWFCLIGIFIKNWDGGKPADVRTLRFPSVLGRIGITYCILATLLLVLPRRIPERLQTTSLIRAFPEVAEFGILWTVVLGMLAVYLGIIFGLNVPGCGRGYFGPGGTTDGGKYFNCTGGATGYIDRLIFTSHHLDGAGGPSFPCREYQCHSFDCLGVLGVIPSVFQTLLGFTAGRILKAHRTDDRPLRLFYWAVGCAALGVVLAVTGFIPVCKSLWSISYVFASTAIAFALLALLYWVSDIKMHWSGSVFSMVGKNGLVLYIFSELGIQPVLNSFSHGSKTFYDIVYGEFFNNAKYFKYTNLGNFLWGMFIVLLVVLLGRYLHRKNKIFKL